MYGKQCSHTHSRNLLGGRLRLRTHGFVKKSGSPVLTLAWYHSGSWASPPDPRQTKGNVDELLAKSRESFAPGLRHPFDSAGLHGTGGDVKQRLLCSGRTTNMHARPVSNLVQQSAPGASAFFTLYIQYHNIVFHHLSKGTIPAGSPLTMAAVRPFATNDPAIACVDAVN